MWRVSMCWLLAIGLGALSSGACQQEGEGGGPTTRQVAPAKDTPGAKAPIPAAQPTADGGVSDGGPAVAVPVAVPGEPGILPDPTQYESTTEYARAVSAFAQDIDVSKAPGYVTKMLQHMRQIIELMEENMKDCDAAAAAVGAYVEKNKAELQALRKEGDEAEAKMSPEEQAKLSAMTLMLMSPYAQDLARVQLQFATVCPKQADEVADMMQALGE